MHKYPKTLHLPWSPGKDERSIEDLSVFINTHIIITEKMDGANTAVTKDGVYTRSLFRGRGEKWSFVNKLWAESILPKGMGDTTLYGENLYTRHTISYELPTFFFLFAALEADKWVDWYILKRLSDIYKMELVPVLFEGSVSSENELKELTNKLGSEKSTYGPEREGVVLRIADEFIFDDFQRYVTKWVRKDHVKGEHHSKRPLEKQKKRTSCRYCNKENTTLIKGIGYLCDEHVKEVP